MHTSYADVYEEYKSQLGLESRRDPLSLAAQLRNRSRRTQQQREQQAAHAGLPAASRQVPALQQPIREALAARGVLRYLRRTGFFGGGFLSFMVRLSRRTSKPKNQ